MQMLARATGNAINLEGMPSEAEALASLAAIALQIPNTEKQELLCRPDMGDLVDRCIDLLKRENRAMQITHDLPTSPEYLDLPFSLN